MNIENLLVVSVIALNVQMLFLIMIAQYRDIFGFIMLKFLPTLLMIVSIYSLIRYFG